MSYNPGSGISGSQLLSAQFSDDHNWLAPNQRYSSAVFFPDAFGLCGFTGLIAGLPDR